MSTPLVWHRATDGHDLALDGSVLVCRNTKGKILKSVPTIARRSETGAKLVELRQRLRRHETECRSAVDSWLLADVPVPAAALAAVWPDPVWRGLLTNLVVSAADTGMLTEVTGEAAGVRGLDGETRWLSGDLVTVTHPATLSDLDKWRIHLAETGSSQGFPQLERRVHRKPDGIDETATSVDSYAGAQFDELRQATGRAAALGFVMRGGYAACRVTEAGRTLWAGYWLGGYDPGLPTATGDLVWTDMASRPVPIRDVGPVAWSEGMRMAELIHDGRNTDVAG